MTRAQLERLILNDYGIKPDFPWIKYPDFAVFRHAGNGKWFALIMSVSKSTLGLEGEEKVDVVNFKCDPLLIGSLRGKSGFLPAYHMNKEKWITALLDGSAPEDEIKMLLSGSFELTAPNVRRKKSKAKKTQAEEKDNV